MRQQQPLRNEALNVELCQLTFLEAGTQLRFRKAECMRSKMVSMRCGSQA